jgi:site-specific DNA-methyltransferase (adenine-specific)
MTKIRLMHRDNMEFMASIPDKFYELAIVDPPYGIGAGNVNFISGTRVKEGKFHRENDWDDAIPTKEYFTELFRISKNQIIWGGNYFTEFLQVSRAWIFWNKLTGNNSYGDGELAWTSFDKTIKMFTLFWIGAHAKERGEQDRQHPTQKAISLYKWLLQNYAKQGDKILDTHGGSMSIAIACADYGFDLDLCELDADYYKDGVNRVKNHLKQSKMFGTEIELILT